MFGLRPICKERTFFFFPPPWFLFVMVGEWMETRHYFLGLMENDCRAVAKKDGREASLMDGVRIHVSGWRWMEDWVRCCRGKSLLVDPMSISPHVFHKYL